MRLLISICRTTQLQRQSAGGVAAEPRCACRGRCVHAGPPDPGCSAVASGEKDRGGRSGPGSDLHCPVQPAGGLLSNFFFTWREMNLSIGCFGFNCWHLICVTDCEDSHPLYPPWWPGRKSHSEFYPDRPGTGYSCTFLFMVMTFDRICLIRVAMCLIYSCRASSKAGPVGSFHSSLWMWDECFPSHFPTCLPPSCTLSSSSYRTPWRFPFCAKSKKKYLSGTGLL